MSLAGNWNIEINSPMGLQKGTLTLAVDGAKLTGTQTGAQGSLPVDGAANGNSGTWKANITTPFPMELEFNVTADGDALTGSVKAGAFGSSPLKGTRA